MWLVPVHACHASICSLHETHNTRTAPSPLANIGRTPPLLDFRSRHRPMHIHHVSVHQFEGSFVNLSPGAYAAPAKRPADMPHCRCSKERRHCLLHSTSTMRCVVMRLPRTRANGCQQAPLDHAHLFHIMWRAPVHACHASICSFHETHNTLTAPPPSPTSAARRHFGISGAATGRCTSMM